MMGRFGKNLINFEPNTDNDYKVYFTTNVNGSVHQIENTDARTFEDVKVFAGDDFFPSANATYRNLRWESYNTGKNVFGRN